MRDLSCWVFFARGYFRDEGIRWRAEIEPGDDVELILIVSDCIVEF